MRDNKYYKKFKDMVKFKILKVRLLINDIYVFLYIYILVIDWYDIKELFIMYIYLRSFRFCNCY